MDVWQGRKCASTKSFGTKYSRVDQVKPLQNLKGCGQSLNEIQSNH